MNYSGLDSKNSEFTPIGGKTSKRRRVSRDEKSLSPSAKFDPTLTQETGTDLKGPNRKIPRFEDATPHGDGQDTKTKVDHITSSDHEEDDTTKLFSEDVTFEHIQLPADEPPTGKSSGGIPEPRNLLSTLDSEGISEPVKQRVDYMDKIRKTDQLKDAQLRLMAGMVRMQNFTDPEKMAQLSSLLSKEGLLQSLLADPNGEKNRSDVKANTSHEECIKIQKDLKEDIAKKSKWISKLETESKEIQRRLQGEINNWKRKFKSLEESKKLLEDSVDKRINTEVISVSQEQKTENDNLRKQLETSKTEYEKKLNELVASSKDKDDTVGKLRAELHSKEQILAELQENLKALEDSKKSLEQKNKELDSQKEAIERELSKVRGNQEANNAKFGKQAEVLQAEKQELEHKLEKLTADVEESTKKFSALQDEQHRKEDELERAIRELKREKQANVDLIDRLTQQVKEKDETVFKKEFLVKRLRESLEMRDSEESDYIKGLRSELKAKLTEITSLKSTNETLQENLESKSDELKQVNTTRIKLKQELEKKEEELLNSQHMVTSLKKDIERKQNSLMDANGKVESLTKQLEKGDLDSAKQEDQLDKLRSEVRDGLERISDLEREKDELEGRLIDLTLRASENDRGEHERRQREINDLKKKIEYSDGQCERLNKELDELREAYRKSQECVARLKNSIQRKEVLLESAKKENIDISTRLLNLKERYEALLEERESSTVIRESKDIIAENEVIKKLEQKIEEIQAKYTEAVTGYKKQVIESNGLLDRIQVLTEDCQALKVSNDDYRRELRRLTNEYAIKDNDFKERILSLEAERIRLNDLLDREKAPSSMDIRNRDLASYYKLKFEREAERSRDLQVVNRYLNSVFKKVDSRLWSDYRKYSRVIADSRRLEEQLINYPYDIPPNSDAYNNYSRDPYGIPARSGKSVNFVDNRSPLIGTSRGRSSTPPKRLKFKTVARFVQACVRLRRSAAKSHWDAQRLRFLRSRLEENREIGGWSK